MYVATTSGTGTSRGVNLRKIERMAVLAFRNALRLHSDAIRLYSHRSYPSAYALSVISVEEIGKFFLLEHVVWNTTINGRGTPDDEHAWLSLMLDHRVKQSQFARNAEVFVCGTRLVRSMWSGALGATIRGWVKG
jgi:AbiV family abortive infection protein